MTKILHDCSSCEGSKYCISKPNKEDYKFPEEENQYLIDLECGIWNCHTAVLNLLKENAEQKAEYKRLNDQKNKLLSNSLSEFVTIDELKNQIEKMKPYCKELCKNYQRTGFMGNDCQNGVCKNCEKWEM